MARAFRRFRQPCEMFNLVEQLSRALFHFERHLRIGGGGNNAPAQFVHELAEHVFTAKANRARESGSHSSMLSKTISSAIWAMWTASLRKALDAAVEPFPVALGLSCSAGSLTVRTYIRGSSSRPSCRQFIPQFSRNLLEMDGPTNQPLGAICLFGAIAGCFWLWQIKKEDDRDRRNFRQDKKLRDGDN